jgi:N-methylhydantoinase B
LAEHVTTETSTTSKTTTSMSPIELAIFISRAEAICAEMGALLQRAAFSPNIKDRLDFSCALFDVGGGLFAQAAHIPVHLGSMAFAMASIVNNIEWQEGDMLVVNDPFLGGTHLPDVTMIAPLFVGGELTAFVANRAHHANIGAIAPGSMPLSKTLEEEGLIIPPTIFMRDSKILPTEFSKLTDIPGADSSGDFAAQISANLAGLLRLGAIVEVMGVPDFNNAISAMNAYGMRLAAAALSEIPAGEYRFTDLMDDNGFGLRDIPISVTITVADRIKVDFSGTSEQVEGNINCPLSVAAAAVFYVFRCLMPDTTPNCAGTFSHIELTAPLGCLVNAERPAATAAGNVETSMRIVDVVLGALAPALPDRIPAASQGTMNNIAMGNHRAPVSWDYYETVGGGMGASKTSHGLSAVQSHMTNTLNTPIESLESHYPLRITEYSIRSKSGGRGQQVGGDGLVKEFLFLEPAEVTLLTERRHRGPWGLAGGEAGQAGVQALDGEPLPAKTNFTVAVGQTLRIETPGGGGFGQK